MRRTVGVLATVALMAVLALAAFAPGAPATTPGTGYGDIPSNIKREFIKGCRQGGGTKRQCTCAINAIDRAYTFRQFMNIIKRVERTGEFPAKTRRIIRRCA